MCGIFGLICNDNSSYSPKLLESIFHQLALYSESRGRESCGFAFKNHNKNEISVVKTAVSISTALKSKQVKSTINNHFKSFFISSAPLIIMGHSRLVTNGSQLDDNNNQPVIKNGIVGVHNGIIVNAGKLWKKYSNLKRDYVIDTEVFLSVIRLFINRNIGLEESITAAFEEMEGTVSAALLFEDFGSVYLGTNNGSLYILTNNSGLLIFASEKHTLQKIITKYGLNERDSKCNIIQMNPGKGILIDSMDLKSIFDGVSKKANAPVPAFEKEEKTVIKILPLDVNNNGSLVNSLVDMETIRNNPKAINEMNILEHNYERINKLVRCAKCILPETFPFIEYDDKGVE